MSEEQAEPRLVIRFPDYGHEAGEIAPPSLARLGDVLSAIGALAERTTGFRELDAFRTANGPGGRWRIVLRETRPGSLEFYTALAAVGPPDDALRAATATTSAVISILLDRPAQAVLAAGGMASIAAGLFTFLNRLSQRRADVQGADDPLADPIVRRRLAQLVKALEQTPTLEVRFGDKVVALPPSRRTLALHEITPIERYMERRTLDVAHAAIVRSQDMAVLTILDGDDEREAHARDPEWIAWLTRFGESSAIGARLDALVERAPLLPDDTPVGELALAILRVFRVARYGAHEFEALVPSTELAEANRGEFDAAQRAFLARGD